MKKIFRITLAVLGKQNVSSINLTPFCTKFLQVFKHFKKAINVDSLS